MRQAASNSKEQFANSPDLKDAVLHTIMDALDAHQTMSTQALGSERIRDGLRDILLGPRSFTKPYETNPCMERPAHSIEVLGTKVTFAAQPRVAPSKPI